MRHAARNDTHCAVPRSTGRALALAAVLLVAARAGAQGTTGANLHLDVRPSVSAVRGDTVRVSYVVTNRVESTDSLFGFTVDVPAHAIRIEVPEPEELWETGSSWRGRPVASWGMLVRHLPPGQSSPALTYEAVGVLDVVRYWGDRFVPVTEGELSDQDAPRPSSPDSIVVDGTSGYTVGVVPVPTDASPGALAGRLGDFVGRACSLGWIDDRGVCTSLQAKARPAPGALGALLHELDAQRGKHVSDAAYTLLRANAEYLLRRL